LFSIGCYHLYLSNVPRVAECQQIIGEDINNGVEFR